MTWHVTGVVAALSLLLTTGCGRPREQAVLAKDVVDFRQLYGENCAGCHGRDGNGGASLPLNYPLYLSLIPKDSLRYIVAHGRPGTSMPAFAQEQGGPLNTKQVSALVEGLEQSWGKPVDLHGIPAPAYLPPPQPGDATRGSQVFESDCASCHGEKGSAGPVATPGYLQLVSDQWIRTMTIAGRPDMGMPDWRSAASGHGLSDQDIADVVAYVTSMRGGGANGDGKKTIQENAK